MKHIIAFKEINLDSVSYFKEQGINSQIIDCYDSENFKSPIGDKDFSSFAKSNNLEDDKKYYKQCLEFEDKRIFYSDSLFDTETKEIVHPMIL